MQACAAAVRSLSVTMNGKPARHVCTLLKGRMVQGRRVSHTDTKIWKAPGVGCGIGPLLEAPAASVPT